MELTSNPSQAYQPPLFRIQWLGVAICLAGFLAYSNSFQGAYYLDDDPCLVNNPGIHSLENAFWGRDVAGGLQRRPVARWTFALNYAAGGLAPWGYHVVNLVIHLAAALLLTGIVHRTLELDGVSAHLRQNATWIAFLVGLIFVLHPLQTQSVTYVVQRIESLMGMFYLATLYFILRGASSCRSWCWYVFAVVSCFLGMGTKEVMVTAPFVILVFDRVFLTSSWVDTFRRRGLVYFLLVLSVCVLLFQVDWARKYSGVKSAKHSVLAYENPVPETTWQYVRTQPEVVLHYLRLVLWPDPLVLDYWWPVQNRWPWLVATWCAVGLLLALTVWGLLRVPRLGFVAMAFFCNPRAHLLGQTEHCV